MHPENLRSRVFLANAVVFVIEMLLTLLGAPERLNLALPFVAAFLLVTLLHLLAGDLRPVAGFSFATWISTFYFYLYSVHGIAPTPEQAIFTVLATALIVLLLRKP